MQKSTAAHARFKLAINRGGGTGLSDGHRNGPETGRLSEAIGTVQTGDYGFQQRLRTAVGLLPPAGQEALGEGFKFQQLGRGSRD
jgi:hypothetical protein